MEVFTFLRMGGSKERIDTLPLKLSSTALARQFAVFDARHSQCFAPEDKERLLGIIEASFGDYPTFNLLVRTMLQGRHVTHIARRVARSRWHINKAAVSMVRRPRGGSAQVSPCSP